MRIEPEWVNLTSAKEYDIAFFHIYFLLAPTVPALLRFPKNKQRYSGLSTLLDIMSSKYMIKRAYRIIIPDRPLWLNLLYGIGRMGNGGESGCRSCGPET